MGWLTILQQPRQVAAGAHAQSLSNPGHRHRGVRAQLAGQFHLGAMSFRPTYQFLLRPTKTFEGIGD
jgi:hypothetical protein